MLLVHTLSTHPYRVFSIAYLFTSTFHSFIDAGMHSKSFGSSSLSRSCSVYTITVLPNYLILECFSCLHRTFSPPFLSPLLLDQPLDLSLFGLLSQRSDGNDGIASHVKHFNVSGDLGDSTSGRLYIFVTSFLDILK